MSRSAGGALSMRRISCTAGYVAITHVTEDNTPKAIPPELRAEKLVPRTVHIALPRTPLAADGPPSLYTFLVCFFGIILISHINKKASCQPANNWSSICSAPLFLRRSVLRTDAKSTILHTRLFVVIHKS